jgi:hypothetical protein
MTKSLKLAGIAFMIVLFLATPVWGEELVAGPDGAQLAAASAPAKTTAPAAAGEAASPEAARDPFASDFETDIPAEGVVANMPAVEVKLEGVGISHDSAYAVINGDLILEGESKGGISVVNVRKQEVDIIANGMPQTLKLAPEDEVKRMQQRKEQKTKKKPAAGPVPA